MSLAVSADPGEYNEQVDTPENANQFEGMENSDEQIPKESHDEIHMNDKDITEVESDEENNDKVEFENDEGTFHVFIIAVLYPDLSRKMSIHRRLAEFMLQMH